jgi:hypothetical protein
VQRVLSDGAHSINTGALSIGTRSIWSGDGSHRSHVYVARHFTSHASRSHESSNDVKVHEQDGPDESFNLGVASDMRGSC